MVCTQAALSPQQQQQQLVATTVGTSAGSPQARTSTLGDRERNMSTIPSAAGACVCVPSPSLSALRVPHIALRGALQLPPLLAPSSPADTTEGVLFHSFQAQAGSRGLCLLTRMVCSRTQSRLPGTASPGGQATPVGAGPPPGSLQFEGLITQPQSVQSASPPLAAGGAPYACLLSSCIALCPLFRPSG